MFATPSKLVCSQLLHTYSLAGACWVDLYVYFDLLTQVGARETESDLQKRIRSMYSFVSVFITKFVSWGNDKRRGSKNNAILAYKNELGSDMRSLLAAVAGRFSFHRKSSEIPWL